MSDSKSVAASLFKKQVQVREFVLASGEHINRFGWSSQDQWLNAVYGGPGYVEVFLSEGSVLVANEHIVGERTLYDGGSFSGSKTIDGFLFTSAARLLFNSDLKGTARLPQEDLQLWVEGCFDEIVAGGVDIQASFFKAICAQPHVKKSVGPLLTNALSDYMFSEGDRIRRIEEIDREIKSLEEARAKLKFEIP